MLSSVRIEVLSVGCDRVDVLQHEGQRAVRRVRQEAKSPEVCLSEVSETDEPERGRQPLKARFAAVVLEPVLLVGAPEGQADKAVPGRGHVTRDVQVRLVDREAGSEHPESGIIDAGIDVWPAGVRRAVGLFLRFFVSDRAMSTPQGSPCPLRS